MRRLRLTLTLYALLSLLDWLLTMWAVESGIATEGNPFMAQAITRGGWGLMLAGKAGAFAFIALVTITIYRLGEWIRGLPELAPVTRCVAWIEIGLISVGQAAVLILNFAQLARVI